MDNPRLRMVLFGLRRGAMKSIGGACQGIDILAIYGDPDADLDALDVHIEEMQTRAAQLGYRVEPHVHRERLQIAVATHGRCELHLDSFAARVDSPCIVTIPGGVVHGFRFQAGAAGWIITIAHQFVLSGGQEGVGASLLQAPYVLELSSEPQRVEAIVTLLAQLYQEFSADRLARMSCIENLLRVLLVYVRRLVVESASTDCSVGRDRRLFLEFRGMVEKQYGAQRSIAEFARALNCSHSRLNRVCRIFTGGSAGTMLHGRVTIEAKRQLIYTAASAAEIAYRLGFQDPSYFSRFFKRQTGLTPGMFRKQHASGRHSPSQVSEVSTAVASVEQSPMA